MRRAIWTDAGLEIVDAEPGPLPEGWVRLKVEACGICGSDLHFWHGDIPRPVGTAPGHEFAGTVIDGPAALADVRYAVSPNVSCGRCEFCTTGRSNLCRRGGYGIGLGRDGGLSEIVDAPVVNLAPLPDGVDPVTASLTEPLAVAVRGVGLANVESDSKVLVLGAGTIGLCAALVARDRAATVTMTARHPHQRAAAERLGVHVLGENDAVPWAKEEKPDVVIETVGGAAGTVDDALRAVRRGGRIVVLGSFNDAKPVDLRALMMKEVALLGSFCYGSGDREPEFTTAARLTGRWRDELRAITTHQFPLDQISTAFDTANDKSTGAIKVTLVP
ncbi:MAG TPA: alcohol dehydrogenase catalytic domain-containing protein [Acidimicrobiales bacterium]|nr:alcohol dehydrogenase catalytic domain-containing protein [Acidimicrobiales bacterium]